MLCILALYAWYLRFLECRSHLLANQNRRIRRKQEYFFQQRETHSNLVHSHLLEDAFDVKEAETHTSFNCTQGCLRTLSNFHMGPSLKIGQFDHQALFGGNL